MGEPEIWSEIVGQTVACAHMDFVLKAFTSDPIGGYLGLISIAYARSQGNEADYRRIPPQYRRLWSKKQFHQIMAWSM